LRETLRPSDDAESSFLSFPVDSVSLIHPSDSERDVLEFSPTYCD
jgi:hypothetical protein